MQSLNYVKRGVSPELKSRSLAGELEFLHTKQALRIVIVRLSAIGDIAMASGLVSSLKSTYPNSEITWVCDAANGAMLENLKGLCRVVCWSKAEWLADLKRFRWLSLVERVKNFKQQLGGDFDLSIDAQGLFKSSVVVWMAKAKHSIVIGGNEGSRWFNDTVVKRDKSDTRMSSEYREIATALGCRDEHYTLLYPTAPELSAFAQNVLEQSVAPDAKIIIAAPFTTRPQKFWPDEHWRNLFKCITDKGYQVLVLGSKADSIHANRLCTGLKGVVNFSGKTRLEHLGSLIQRADGLVGVDTGITHIAVATGIPVVALFGSTCPYLFPLSERATVLYDDFACSPCHRKPSCDGGFECMSSIFPNRVMAVLEDLL